MKFLALWLLMFLQAGQHSQQAVQIPQGEHAPGNFLSGVITWAGSTPPLKQSVVVPADWRCTTFNDDPREPTMIGVVCTKPVLVDAPKRK